MPEDTDCLWCPERAGKVPRDWHRKGTKKGKVYLERSKYNKHMELLNSVFFSEDSPFALKQTTNMGLGVFAKRRIEADEFNSKLCKIIVGFKTVHHYKNDSHSDASLMIRRNGKHHKKGEKREYEVRNIYGPLVFANHACENHAHAVLSQRRNGDPFMRMQPGKVVKKGEQLYMHYGYGYDDISCFVCK